MWRHWRRYRIYRTLLRGPIWVDDLTADDFEIVDEMVRDGLARFAHVYGVSESLVVEWAYRGVTP